MTLKPLDKKKLTAAIAGVLYYIQSEEEAIAVQAANRAQQENKQKFAGPSAWGNSGRQSQMQMRNLMQLKTFHR